MVSLNSVSQLRSLRQPVKLDEEAIAARWTVSEIKAPQDRFKPIFRENETSANTKQNHDDHHFKHHEDFSKTAEIKDDLARWIISPPKDNSYSAAEL